MTREPPWTARATSNSPGRALTTIVPGVRWPQAGSSEAVASDAKTGGVRDACRSQLVVPRGLWAAGKRGRPEVTRFRHLFQHTAQEAAVRGEPGVSRGVSSGTNEFGLSLQWPSSEKLATILPDQPLASVLIFVDADGPSGQPLSDIRSESAFPSVAVRFPLCRSRARVPLPATPRGRIASATHAGRSVDHSSVREVDDLSRSSELGRVVAPRPARPDLRLTESSPDRVVRVVQQIDSRARGPVADFLGV